jgi:hypothetical protein
MSTPAVPLLAPPEVLTAFSDALLAAGRVRYRLEDLHHLWAQADSAWAGQDATRARLSQALARLAADAVIELPSPGGHAWDAGIPALPQHVTLPRNRQQRPEVLDPATEAWAPAMHWAAEWIRTAHPPQLLRQDAVALNRWLLATTGTAPAQVAREERSLHIFDNEKRLTALASGPLFAPGRLNLADLACSSPAGALRIAVLRQDGPVLVVENRATFDSAWRALRGQPAAPYAAVVFGGGDAATALVNDLCQLPDLVGVTARRADYAGDVDIAGVEAAHSFVTTVRGAGIPAGTNHALWEAVARAQPTGPDTTADTSRSAQAIRMAAELGMPHEVIRRLEEGVRVPQERVDRQSLSSPQWWTPPGG